MYAVIDIETTGGNYRWGKITEIAIFIYDGKKVIEEFTTLVNPKMAIPYFITQLTGISDEMVKDAPVFAEIAPEIERLTEGKVFVAHNAQFDYNFIRHEFRLLGIEFERPTLCTVRAGRRILPNHASYSLGKLCQDLHIEIENRHRAGGDTAATVKLLEHLQTADKDNLLSSLVQLQQPGSEYNKYLESGTIEDLPQAPGICYLYGADQELLYIDSARNIRKRVISHLRNKGGRETLNIREKIKSADFEETGTYLIAQLRAQEEILKNKPVLNSQPKATTVPKRWYIVPDLRLDGYLHLTLERLQTKSPSASFRTKKETLVALEKLISKNRLCAALTPLSASSRSCMNGHTVSCQGACKAQEEPGLYNKRIDMALQSLEENTNQLIVEKGRNPAEKSLIKIENNQLVSWGYMNLEEKQSGLESLLECTTTVCRSPAAGEIAMKYLLKNNVQKIISY